MVHTFKIVVALLFAFTSISLAQPPGGSELGVSVRYGDLIHLQNFYNQWEGGYLDIRGAGCEENSYCVSTSESQDRDPGGRTGTWKILSADGKPEGDVVRYGDQIYLQNQYGNGIGGYLHVRGYGCEGNTFCVSTFSEAEREPGSNTGVWKISSAGIMQDGYPIPYEFEVVLLNKYNNWQGGYLHIRGAGCEDNKYCVSTFSQREHEPGSGTGVWRMLETAGADRRYEKKTLRIISLSCSETTELGEDEVYINVKTATASYRMPASSYHSMNEGDPNLSHWNINRPFTQSSRSKITITVKEEDDGLNDDDIIGVVTVDLNSIAYGPHSARLTGADSKYTLRYVIEEESSNRIQEFEKSPQIADVVSLVNQISAPASTVVNASIPGFVAAYDSNNQIRRDDHPSGITMTPRGRIVTTMSRTNPDANNPKGVLIWSSPYAIGRDELSWEHSAVLKGHPSAIQAVGEFVATAEGGAAKLFLLPTDGRPFQEIANHGIPGGEAVGITYNAIENRFYAFGGGGGVTVEGEPRTISLHRTAPNASLLDPGTRFEHFMDISNVYVSGQGSHLVTQQNGDMFVISTFSTNEDPNVVNETAICAELPEPGNFTHTTFRDVLTVTRLDTDSGVGSLVATTGSHNGVKDVGVAQWQCVKNRPAWRYGGGVAPIGPTTMIALWAGRFFTITDTLDDDDFEFATQRLSE